MENTQIDKQSKKISGNIASLKKGRPFLPMHSRLIMFNAFVLPYFTYCSTVWNDGTSSIIEKLTKLQGRVAHVINGE